MYWYYKYPLYAILALLVFGLGYLVYKQLPSHVKDNLTITQAAVDDQDAAAVSAPPARGTPATPVPVNDRGSATAVEALFARQLRAAQEQLANGNLVAARALAQQVLKSGEVQLFDAAWNQAAKIVSRVNTELINSDAPAPEKVRYEIQSGNTLVEIAQRYRSTVGALQRGNSRLSPDVSRIFPGMVLNIYVADWSILVDKDAFKLLLMDGGTLFKVYDIAIGRQGRTPEGTFKVVNKLREPAWTPPGRNIPYGDPENVLGTRWLGLEATGDTDQALRGYGIHGTWEPESIGSAASEGCVRLQNDDVNELFDIVPVGTKVTIRE